ncbi:MAG: hypothetical protein WBM35_00820, partial [Candidatus Electrothrix sp.]
TQSVSTSTHTGSGGHSVRRTQRTYRPTVHSSSPVVRRIYSSPVVRSYSSPITRSYTSRTYTPTVRSSSSSRIPTPVLRAYSPTVGSLTKGYVSPSRYYVSTTTPATRITIPSVISTPTSQFIVPSTITTPATRTTYTRSIMQQRPIRRYTSQYDSTSCPPPLPKPKAICPPPEPDYCPPEPCCP